MSDQTFGIIAAFCIFVLPVIIISAVAIVFEIRDRAYLRGYEEAWDSAVIAQRQGRTLVS